MTTIQFLAEWALRSSILILSGALLLRALRVKDASIRLAAWTAMLCGSLAIPAITALAPRMAAPVMRPAPQSLEAPVAKYVVAAEAVPEAPRHATSVSRPFDWARAAVTIYSLVAFALLLRLCFGLAMSLRLLRGSRPTDLTTQGIRIRESDRVTTPVTLGVARPAIVLPNDWRGWPSAKLDAVLAHESSHIRRHDPAVHLLSAIHRVLLWHSPLSWFLHQRIVRLAEEASDDAAVAVTRDRALYAEVLLDFMRRAVRTPDWQGVPMARYGAPAKRIHRILDGTALSRGVTRWSIAAILALGVPLAYVVAAVQAAPRPQAAGSTAAKPLTFDVASVKPAIVPDGVTVVGEMRGTRKGSGISVPPNTGGPGTGDPGRIHFPLISLKALLARAWGSYFEIVGPGWLDSQIVQVDATMPSDTTNEQFQEMLRNLITDRFQLKHHTETKQITGYALVVAKNGQKMKASADQGEAEYAPPKPPTGMGKDGFPIHPPAAGKMLVTERMDGGRSRITCQQVTIQAFAENLSRQLKAPITNATGLTAKYDFTLTYTAVESASQPADSPEGLEPLPDIFGALQSQLGLKLERKPVPVEVFVVDHMEKTPTGN